MNFSEKMLPNQDENKKLYTGSELFLDKMYSVVLNSCQLDDFDEEYSFQVHKDFSMESMSVSPVYFSLLETLISIKPYRKILEIGSFLGSTSLKLSNIVGKHGHVTTIEKYDQFADIAKKNIAKNCKFDNVNLIVGDAINIIENMDKSEKFDFVFLDGNKERYYDYIMLIDTLLEDGGMIVVDDIFFHGDALNENPSTQKGKGAKKVLDSIKKLTNYKSTILPIGNGCLLLTRKPA
jgi:caffeoyl-CoA O-methyltransferase/O-methyltransferase